MKKVLVCLGVLVALASSAPAAPAGAKEDALWEKLRGKVEAVERGLDGVLGLSVKDLASGRTLEIRPDESFPQASTIKWTILYKLEVDDVFCLFGLGIDGTNHVPAAIDQPVDDRAV